MHEIYVEKLLKFDIEFKHNENIQDGKREYSNKVSNSM